MKTWLALALVCFSNKSYSSSVSDYRWGKTRENPTLTYRIDSIYDSSRREAFLENVEEAVAKWNGVKESFIQLVEVDSSAELDISLVSEALHSGAGSPTIDDNGNISYCTLEVSDFSDSAQRRRLITHEMGHCLGLFHSSVPGAMMSYRAGNSTELNDDDRYQLALLYPMQDQNLPIGCNSTARADEGSPLGWSPFANGFYFLLLGVLFLVIRNKRLQIQ